MSSDRYIFTSYDFISNGTGELMLVMDAPVNFADEDSARFIYDKHTQKAILHRNLDQIVYLPTIAPELDDLIQSISTIIVTEMDGEDIEDVYEATVEIGEVPIISTLADRADDQAKGIVSNTTPESEKYFEDLADRLKQMDND